MATPGGSDDSVDLQLSPTPLSLDTLPSITKVVCDYSDRRHRLNWRYIYDIIHNYNFPQNFSVGISHILSGIKLAAVEGVELIQQQLHCFP